MTFRLNFTWIARLLAILAVGEAVFGIILALTPATGTPGDRAIALLGLLGSAVLFMALARALANAFVQVNELGLRVKAGFLLDVSAPVSAIAQVEPSKLPWWSGVGIHTDFRGTIAAISYPGRLVTLSFREPQPGRMFPFPVKLNVKKLLISPERREDFMTELSSRMR